MNKFYIIVPVVLLGVFLFFYNGALKEMAAKEAAKQEEVAKVKAAEDARRAEIERKAAEDAKRRQAEREAEDRAKEQKKIKEYEDAMQQLKDEADKYLAEADKNQKDANALELQLNDLRSTKEKTNRETFELAKQVELAKIARRNAELEIQRMVDMVAQKVGASSFAAMPPPPAPAKK
jgi:membrane-associated HD superfamily phosphohydrolase